MLERRPLRDRLYSALENNGREKSHHLYAACQAQHEPRNRTAPSKQRAGFHTYTGQTVPNSRLQPV